MPAACGHVATKKNTPHAAPKTQSSEAWRGLFLRVLDLKQAFEFGPSVARMGCA
jgi:hypothetical protein